MKELLLNKLIKWVLLCIVTLTIMGQPTVLMAQEVGQSISVEDICDKAGKDVEKDLEMSSTMWAVGTMVSGFALGPLLGLIPIPIAYMVSSSPPTYRLLGKSQDYAMVYTKCYKEKSRKQHMYAALGGYVGYILLVLLLASSD